MAVNMEQEELARDTQIDFLIFQENVNLGSKGEIFKEEGSAQPK